MTLLVTGATGFVMSVLGRHWLEADPDARLVVLDSAPLDAAAQRYFAPVMKQLSVVTADVTQPETWHAALADHGVTHIVHGATITPISRGSASEAKREPEAEHPARIIDVNVMGTVAVLEWARTLPNFKRFLYVSSGAVYKHHGPDRPDEPLPEDGYVMPRRLYGISKLASELITERYGDLFGLSTASVRPSSVYGTMDRVTTTRNMRHTPNRIAHLAVDGVQARAGQYARCAGRLHPFRGCRARHGLSAARATPALQCLQRRLRCNRDDRRYGRLGGGKGAGLWRRDRASRGADILQDPTLKEGMWGAYDISRLSNETGWKPRPVREALHAYMDWIVAERDAGPQREAR